MRREPGAGITGPFPPEIREIPEITEIFLNDASRCGRQQSEEFSCFQIIAHYLFFFGVFVDRALKQCYYLSVSERPPLSRSPESEEILVFRVTFRPGPALLAASR
jgi:hypothetical protein